MGIIQRAYAGTPIEGWMPWDIQRNDPRAQAHKKGLDDSANRMIGRGETSQKALEGFPASPFRTDDWPLYDPKAEQIEVTKPEKPKGYEAKDWSRPVIK